MKEPVPLLLGPNDVVVRVRLSCADPDDTRTCLVAAKWSAKSPAVDGNIVSEVTLLDVRALDDQERLVYARWMGIGCPATTFSEIGTELGVSREAARALFARAANKATRHNGPEETAVSVGG